MGTRTHSLCCFDLRPLHLEPARRTGACLLFPVSAALTVTLPMAPRPGRGTVGSELLMHEAGCFLGVWGLEESAPAGISRPFSFTKGTREQQWVEGGALSRSPSVLPAPCWPPPQPLPQCPLPVSPYCWTPGPCKSMRKEPDTLTLPASHWASDPGVAAPGVLISCVRNFAVLLCSPAA